MVDDLLTLVGVVGLAAVAASLVWPRVFSNFCPSSRAVPSCETPSLDQHQTPGLLHTWAVVTMVLSRATTGLVGDDVVLDSSAFDSSSVSLTTAV